MEWSWIPPHLPMLRSLTLDHLKIAGCALLIGVGIAIPLGVVAQRRRLTRSVALGICSVLFTVPSLALFVLLLPITGLTETTAIVGLAAYTLVILVRNTMEGLDSVPAQVREAALAMGLGRLRALLTVELPLALPVIMAGVRVAAVTIISLVSVAEYIGYGGLGQLFTAGFQRDFTTPVIAGVLLTVLLALVCDALLVGLQRVCTPWRTGKVR
jgi:osmoprotectant transport system permease protein